MRLRFGCTSPFPLHSLITGCVCVFFYRIHKQILHVAVSCNVYVIAFGCHQNVKHLHSQEIWWLPMMFVPSINDDGVVVHTHICQTHAAVYTLYSIHTKQTITHQLQFWFVIFNLHSFFSLSSILCTMCARWHVPDSCLSIIFYSPCDCGMELCIRWNKFHEKTRPPIQYKKFISNTYIFCINS